jgi:hypothetical protein
MTRFYWHEKKNSGTLRKMDGHSVKIVGTLKRIDGVEINFLAISE